MLYSIPRDTLPPHLWITDLLGAHSIGRKWILCPPSHPQGTFRDRFDPRDS